MLPMLAGNVFKGLCRVWTQYTNDSGTMRTIIILTVFEPYGKAGRV